MAIINDDDNGNVITGTEEPDEIYGNGGDDTITGSYADTVSGGDGADVLIGEYMSGDAGNDTLIVTTDNLGTIIDGGDGQDTLILSSPDFANYFEVYGQVISIESLVIDSPHDAYINLYSEQFQYGEFSHSLLVKLGSGASTINIRAETDSNVDLSGLEFENWGSDDHITIEVQQDGGTITGTSLNDEFMLYWARSLNGSGGDDRFMAGVDVNRASIDGGSGWDEYVLRDIGGNLFSSQLTNCEEIAFETNSRLSIDPKTLAFAFSHGTEAITGAADFAVTLVVFMFDETVFDASVYDIAGWSADDRFGIGGGIGDDSLTGSVRNEDFGGYIGNDTVLAGAGDDIIAGYDGADRLVGQSGNDTVTGGAGQDRMSGGEGTDVFVYTAVTDSARGTDTRDFIWFFRHNDTLDVSAIDANELIAGDQVFVLDAGGDYSAGEIRILASGSNWLISFNTDADALAEMQIVLHQSVKPVADDFVF